MAQGLRAGQTLHNGTYRIERVLGQGSFGITYLAKAKFTTHGNLGEMKVEAQVAIKEFFMNEVNSRRADGSTVEGSTGSVFTNYRKKFKKEAENLAKLSHPNIVKVFDVFDENNTTYYVMEFLEGDNLDDYIKRQGQLTEQVAIDVVSAVGNAVDYMHSQKMLHLDIKPKNIMRRSDGRNYLIDFGLSKQFTDDGEPESSTSIGLGTPGYSPIEQASYKQDGTFPATLDVYALGATMFKMLTGKRPPEATNILNEGFPEEGLTQCGVSQQTAAAVERAMEPMKKKRYNDVRAFLNELDEGTVPVPPVPIPSSKPKPQNHVIPLLQPNKNWYIFAIVVTVIVLAVYISDILYSNISPQEQLTTPTDIQNLQRLPDIPRQQQSPIATATPERLEKPIYDTMTINYGLAHMARKFYGRSVYWVFIYQANADSFDNPNKIIPGTRVRIPAKESFAEVTEAATMAKASYIAEELRNKYDF